MFIYQIIYQIINQPMTRLEPSYLIHEMLMKIELWD